MKFLKRVIDFFFLIKCVVFNILRKGFDVNEKFIYYLLWWEYIVNKDDNEI